VKIPFADLASLHAALGAELQHAWERVATSGWYVLGPELEAFEQEFANYCGASQCVGVGNGLDALTLILHAMNIGPGHEVIVPSYTFIATWFAVTRVGALPVPVEPDEHTYNINPARIEEAITPRTAAILAVDLYGQLANIQDIRRVGERHRLNIVEDAAQAHGARGRGGSAGGWADAAAFSFFPTKNLGCLGDGGAVVTNDRILADKLRLLRNYGSCTKYFSEIPGFNSRLDPLQAAFLRVKLRYLDKWNAQRRGTAIAYSAGLSDLPDVKLPKHDATQEDHVWHLYVIYHPRRDDLQRALRTAGIETLIHYPIPPHLSQAYATLGLAGRLPIAERLAAQALSLPIGPHIGPAQAAEVIRVTRQFCFRCG
jgi:dTDP-4-amino-4,6-dideoxygalactose transaminase